MARSPEDRALATVAKAIKDADRAERRYVAADAKVANLLQGRDRAQRFLQHVLAHPDLPEGFDLDDFRASLTSEPDVAVRAPEATDPDEDAFEPPVKPKGRKPKELVEDPFAEAV
jgi:hypothetical protein